MSNRLHLHMAHMVASETSIGTILERVRDVVSDHADMREVVDGCIELAKSQRQAIESRLHDVAKHIELPDIAGPDYPDDYGLPLATAIQRVHIAIDSAIVGYSILQLLALRHRDNYLVGDGNTADLAVAHCQNYIGVMSKINSMLHDVVVWELDRDGIACRCTCPCCDLGVCLCAPSSRANLNDVWGTAGPKLDKTGIYVYRPRPDSAAALAGLNTGDVIEAVDGDELESLWTMHDIVDARETGASMRFRVRRQSGDIALVSVARPQASDE